MALPITTDLGHNPDRVLAKQFDTAGTKGGDLAAAAGSTDPNALNTNGNGPSVLDAMGTVPESGMVSFTSDVSSRDWTIYIWNTKLNALSDAAGWMLGAESAALNTKTVAQRSLASFKAPPGAAYFLKMSSAGAGNLVVHDGGHHPANENTDETYLMK